MHPLRRPAFRAGARGQRGLSLTEMMVGLTVGLFITGAALMAAVNATGENRRLLLEARLLQDLRATMDLVTRSLRRAGYWGNAQAGVRAVGDAAAQSGYEATGYAVVTPTSDSATTVQFRVASDADDSADDDETLGFRLATGSDGIGRVQVLLAGAAAYQDLTDPAVTHVTEFTVEALPQAAVALTCPSACGTSPLPACPTLQVRQYRITMRAQAVSDAAVRRGLQSTVRLRNDLLSGACP